MEWGGFIGRPMSAEWALETSRTILTRGGTQLNETCPKKRVRGGSALEY